MDDHPFFAGAALRLRAGSIPLRIEASFLLLAGALAATRLGDAAAFASWIVALAAALVVHELGHAVAARAAGLAPSIAITFRGGRTTWPAEPPLAPRRALGVWLAGPAAGLAFAALCFAARRGVAARAPALAALLADGLHASAAWGALNLLPVIPLAGHRALEAALRLASPALADARLARRAQVVSLAVGAGAGVAALLHAHGDLGAPIPALEPAFLPAGLLLVWGAWESRRRLVEAERDERLARAIEADLPRIEAAQQESLAAAPTPTPTPLSRDRRAWVEALVLLYQPPRAAIDPVRWARVREAAAILGRDAAAAPAGEAIFAGAPDPDLALELARAWTRAGDAPRAARWLATAHELGNRADL